MARNKHGEISEVICVSCGYRGPDDGSDTCPLDRGQLIPVNELGGDGFEDDLGLDADEPKGTDDLESFEGLQEDEDSEDDKFDDEDDY